MLLRFSVAFGISALVIWFLAGFAVLDWNVFQWTKIGRTEFIIASIGATFFFMAGDLS